MRRRLSKIWHSNFVTHLCILGLFLVFMWFMVEATK